MANGLIYHYTDSGGLYGILSSNSLWLTDILHLNDREELSYGTSVVRARITELIRDLEPHAGPGAWYESWEGSRIELLRRIDGHLDPEQLRREPNHGVYVSCFCRDGDLLSQWRGYAGGVGGFSIGFDPVLLPQRESSDAEGFGARPILSEVRYGLDAGNQLLEPVLARLDQFSGSHVGVNAELKTVDVLRIVAQIKHPGFREEDELRLIETESWSGPAAAQFRTGPRGLIPYRMHCFPKDAVREIVVGPGDGRDQVRAAKHLLNSLEYPGVTVRQSEVPFR